MAVGRISVKTGSKGKGQSHANYILRQDKYKTHASKSEKLEHTASGNMPEWATDNPAFFWKMADEHERKNGSVYREHILTLPRELDESQRLELVREWVKQEIGDKHPYTYAIHNPIAMDGKEQPHAHLMICERELDGVERGADTFFKRYNAKSPEKGGAKKANTGLDRDVRKAMLKEQRSRWGDLVNKHLERANSKSRVDMRNWKEKGLPEKPLNISMQDFQDTHKRLFDDGTIKRVSDPNEQGGQTVKDLYTRKLLLKRELKQALSTYDRLPKATDYRPPEKVTFTTEPPAPTIAPSETNKQPATVEPVAPPAPQYENAQDEYNELRKTIANKLFKDDLKQLQAQGQPLLKQLDNLAKNKPLFWGKDKWQQQHDKILNDYNRIKTAHDEIKKGGVSKYFDKAREQIEQTRPELVARYKQELIAEMRADDEKRLAEFKAKQPTAHDTVTKHDERNTMLNKAKISLQTIKNVIDTMPDNHPNRAKALDSYNQRLQSFERMSDEQLRQVTATMPDTVANKTPETVIKAPTTEQDPNKGR